MQDCAAGDAPSEFVGATCARKGTMNACWVETDSMKIECSFDDFEPKEGVEAYAVNYGSNGPNRVSVFGNIDFAGDEPVEFCCVADGGPMAIYSLSMEGTKEADILGFRYQTSNLDVAVLEPVARGAGNGDTLYGSHNTSPNYQEKLYGGAGNDTIDAGNGDDRVYGNAGEDQLFGGEGADEIWGGGHTDYIYGQGGADILRGQHGNDWIYTDDQASADFDVAYGGDGDDTIECRGGDCIGGEGDDKLYGKTHGRDLRLHGGPGNDILEAGQGLHTHVLYGGVGADSLQGSPSTDIFCENGRKTATTFLTSNFSDNQDFIGISGTDVLDVRDAWVDFEVYGDRGIYQLWTDVVPGFQVIHDTLLHPSAVAYPNTTEYASCAQLRSDHGAW